MAAFSASAPARKPRVFKGQRRHANKPADIEVVSIRDKTSPACPDYRVTCAGVEVGAGWSSVGQTTKPPWVGLSLRHPDIGSCA
jgi:uncharacterized protein (DUF736 family)